MVKRIRKLALSDRVKDVGAKPRGFAFIKFRYGLLSRQAPGSIFSKRLRLKKSPPCRKKARLLDCPAFYRLNFFADAREAGYIKVYPAPRNNYAGKSASTV
jgi:hypothetical protein